MMKVEDSTIFDFSILRLRFCGQAMFFISKRSGSNELLAYIPKTGELCSVSPKGKNIDYWYATVHES